MADYSSQAQAGYEALAHGQASTGGRTMSATIRCSFPLCLFSTTEETHADAGWQKWEYADGHADWLCEHHVGQVAKVALDYQESVRREEAAWRDFETTRQAAIAARRDVTHAT